VPISFILLDGCATLGTKSKSLNLSKPMHF
jgi:hypothetical protein